MKKFLLSLVIILNLLQSKESFGQVTVTVDPNTPLDYFVTEATTPKIINGYNQIDIQFGNGTFYSTIGTLKQTKYSDLPIYSTFSETVDFVSTLESKSTISRTSDYVSYILEVREDDTKPFEVFAKDTFYFNGSIITSITEVLYDEVTEGNTLKYDVVYDANSKIKEITLKAESLNNLKSNNFAGLKVGYNANQTIKTDTVYAATYDFESGDYIVGIDDYHDFFYSSTNPLKLDSSFVYEENTIPKQSERDYYVLNSNNEITTINISSYNSNSGKFEKQGRLLFKVTATPILLTAPKAPIQLYPNPVGSTLFVLGSDAAKKWSIMDQKGNVVNSGSYSAGQGISVENLMNGQYFLYMNNEKESWSGKFVK